MIAPDAWERIRAERDPRRKVGLMVGAGLLESHPDGVGMSAAARRMVAPYLRDMPALALARAAAEVEGHHRMMPLGGEPLAISADELDELLRAVNGMLAEAR